MANGVRAEHECTWFLLQRPKGKQFYCILAEYELRIDATMHAAENGIRPYEIIPRAEFHIQTQLQK